MNHEYAIQIVWSDEDAAYIGMAAELPGCMADGSTPEEALANIRVVIQEWIETAKEEGRDIPQPLTVQGFAKMQGEAQGQMKNYIENEVRKAVVGVLSEMAKQHQPSIVWGQRGAFIGPTGEGCAYGDFSALVRH